MERHYQEAIEICSELIVGGVYEELAALGEAGSAMQGANVEAARRCRAEARLLMATAMHYADGHYEDIARVLSFALESPAEIQKDVFFTLAVVHLSFGHSHEAAMAMQRSLELITELSSRSREDQGLQRQEEEAREFLKQLSPPSKSS